MSSPFYGLLIGAIVCGMGESPAPSPAKAESDEQLLRAAKVTSDGPSLCEFFRRQTPTTADVERLHLLIKRLGSETFAIREKASGDLIRCGPPALFALRQAASCADLEVRHRALRCIEAIHADLMLPAAAARTLGKVRLPDEALPVLLTYLPYAPNTDIEEELLTVLVVLGVEHGRARPMLLASLKDEEAARRAAAALIVGRIGTTAQKRQVGALLADTSPEVRLRAAQGLLAAHEKKAVPVLIQLLDNRSPEWTEEAIFLLELAAGWKKPPSAKEQGTRPMSRAAWETLWKEQGDSLDLRMIVSTLKERLEYLQGLRSFHEKQWRRYRNLADARAIDARLVEEVEQLVRNDDRAIAKARRFLRLWGVQPTRPSWALSFPP